MTARSAGLEPGGHIYDTAMAAMDEVGISLEHAYPKPLSADVHRAAQLVITLSCADWVQRLEGKDYREWAIPSLEGRPLDEVRAMRDDLDARVRDLIREIGPDAGA